MTRQPTLSTIPTHSTIRRVLGLSQSGFSRLEIDEDKSGSPLNLDFFRNATNEQMEAWCEYIWEDKVSNATWGREELDAATIRKIDRAAEEYRSSDKSKNDKPKPRDSR